MAPCKRITPNQEQDIRDPVLGLSLQGVAPEEQVDLGGTQVWAPALVWLWTALGQCAHPLTLQPLAPEDTRSVVRAAFKACSGSATGPARFLCSQLAGEVHTEAELLVRLQHLCAAPALRLPVVLAAQLGIIQEVILTECSLDAVQDAQSSVQTLSVSWLWLFDALWGQLVRLDAPLALDRMLHTALPAFRDALTMAWGFHPLVLAPVVRHFVFLEEYVCRAALGTLEVPGPWRYERFADALFAPTQGRGLRTGFAEWPLGPRSHVTVVPHCSAHELAYVEAQFEHAPLVDAAAAPPVPEPPRAAHPVSSTILSLLQRELGDDEALSSRIRVYPDLPYPTLGGVSLGQILSLHPSSVESFDLTLLAELEAHAPQQTDMDEEQDQQEAEENTSEEDDDVIY